MPTQHGDAGGAGGRRGLRGDSGGHPRGVLQVRQRPFHRDSPTRRRRGGPWLREGALKKHFDWLEWAVWGKVLFMFYYLS